MYKKAKRRKNINAKGDSLYDPIQHLRLKYKMLESPQFRSLGGNDVRVLLELAIRHHGYNNGRIGAGLADLADTLKMSKSTVQRSLRNLQKTKFIIMRKRGRFQGRIASEWEVTFLEIGGRNPTNEWGQAKVLPYKRKLKEKTPLNEIYEECERQQADKLESGT
jgi:DNA-binding transcriptional MocR family regulator